MFRNDAFTDKITNFEFYEIYQFAFGINLI